MKYLKVLSAKVGFFLEAYARLFYRFGQLAPILFTLFNLLILYNFFRIVLCLIYWERIVTESNLFKIFILGPRMDLIIPSYLLIIPALFLLILPKKLSQYAKYLLIPIMALLFGFSLKMEIATIPFLEQYDLRPDRIFFEYLKYPKEVFQNVWAETPFMFLFMIFGLIGGTYTFAKLQNLIFKNYKPIPWYLIVPITPIVLSLLFLGGRSSLDHRPANISTASFSYNHLVNEITLNSTYSVLYAVYRIVRHENKVDKSYGWITNEEIFQRVKSQTIVKREDWIQSEIPFYHEQKSPFKLERPMNIVIFLQESIGAEHTGYLGGLPLTPNIDRLAKEGMYFTKLFSTGTRTVRGIEATITGFLPTPQRSIVKQPLSRKGFYTVAHLLKRHGYSTNFIYGGMSNFDEMKSFFLGNGFDSIIDQKDFNKPVFEGIWGVSDEDLVQKAHEQFLKHGNNPFFSLILSTSNHSPFEFPEGRIELFNKEKKDVQYNAMKYADYAVGKFFKLAKSAPYYKNTLFLVIADHNTRVHGDDLVPVYKFHIPGFIIGPNVPKKEFSKVASQVDMLPTLLHFSGLKTKHPMIGKNLMTLPEDHPGTAFMQYGLHNGYMVGDQVIVSRQNKKPLQFKYEKNILKPVKLNHELSSDALAHILLPWKLYMERRYSLPELNKI